MALFPLPGLLNPAQESVTGAVPAPSDGSNGAVNGQSESFSQVLKEVADGTQPVSEAAQGAANEQTLPTEAENLSAAETETSPTVAATGPEAVAMERAETSKTFSSLLLFLAYMFTPPDDKGAADQSYITGNNEEASSVTADVPEEGVSIIPEAGSSQEADLSTATQNAYGLEDGQGSSAISFVFSFLAVLFHWAGGDNDGDTATDNVIGQKADTGTGAAPEMIPAATDVTNETEVQPSGSPGWTPSPLLPQDEGWGIWMYTARFSMDAIGHITGEAQRAAALYSPSSMIHADSTSLEQAAGEMNSLKAGTSQEARLFPIGEGETSAPEQVQKAESGGRLDVYVDKVSFSGNRTSLLDVLRGGVSQGNTPGSTPQPLLSEENYTEQNVELFPGMTQGRASDDRYLANPLFSSLHDEFHFEVDGRGDLKPVDKGAEVAKDSAVSTAHASGTVESSKSVAQPGRAAQAAMLDAGQRADIIKQIESGLLQSLRLREHKAMLQLHPPELGRLHVELSVSSNHQVNANFMAEHPEVKQIIEGQIQLLKDHLAQNGFTLADVNVDVSGEQFQGQFQEQPSFSASDFGHTADEKLGSITSVATEEILDAAAASVMNSANGLDLTV